jgi:hypothetical protein
MAGAAAGMTLLDADLNRLRIQLVADAGAALLVLIVTTALSVYKPWGRTRYGRRTERLGRSGTPPPFGSPDAGIIPAFSDGTPWGRYVLLAILGFALVVGAVHLAGGGLGGH